jgi:hypothetical protein
MRDRDYKSQMGDQQVADAVPGRPGWFCKGWRDRLNVERSMCSQEDPRPWLAFEMPRQRLDTSGQHNSGPPLEQS